MQQPSITVHNLHVAIQRNTVIDGISFSLNPNQHLAILGASGSGKTTLINALHGKIHFSGEVKLSSSFENQKPVIACVHQRYTFKNSVGLVDFYYQQRFNSYDSENAPSIYDELISICEADSEIEKLESIESGLKRLGISHLKHAPLIQLSSGEHKRFQLLRACINPPDYLLLDSPYTGLDVASRSGLNEILKELADNGTQIIMIPGTFPIPEFITHMARLDKGKMNYFGIKHNEYTDPQKEDQLTYESPFNSNLFPEPFENRHSGKVIELVNTSVQYGNKSIVQNINWTVNSGEKWLLKGPNGAGKSTLLNLITGDHPQAYSNEIYLFGKRRGTGESIWDIKSKTGYVSPELHAYFNRNTTCLQAIGSGFFDTIGLFRKLSREQRLKIDEWVQYLELEKVQHQYLHSLSTSLQRLTLLARALVKNPPLLILDEPCQGIDLHQREQFLSLINHIGTHTDTTIVYVSHEDHEIPDCMEKVILLENKSATCYQLKTKKVLEAFL